MYHFHRSIIGNFLFLSFEYCITHLIHNTLADQNWLFTKSCAAEVQQSGDAFDEVKILFFSLMYKFLSYLQQKLNWNWTPKYRPLLWTCALNSTLIVQSFRNFSYVHLKMKEQIQGVLEIFQGHSLGPGVISRRINFWKLMTKKSGSGSVSKIFVSTILSP